MEALHIENLVKKYNNFTLGSINIDLDAGYIVAVIGKNGCGKSTLFNCMLGMESYDGICEWKGAGAAKVSKSFAYVLERCPFPKEYSAKEIAECYSSFYRDFDKRRYYALLARYNIPIGRPLRKLSRGSIMLVQIAFAFAYKSEVLFLDEATAHLDSYARQELYDLISDYAAEGHMVFWSSHRMEELDRMADYVIGIKKGQQVLFGTREEITERYHLIKGSSRQLDFISRALIGRRDSEAGASALVDTNKDYLKLGVYDEPAGLGDIVDYLL